MFPFLSWLWWLYYDKNVHNENVRLESTVDRKGIIFKEKFSKVAGSYRHGKMHPLVSFVLLAFSSCLIKKKA